MDWTLIRSQALEKEAESPRKTPFYLWREAIKKQAPLRSRSKYSLQAATR